MLIVAFFVVKVRIKVDVLFHLSTLSVQEYHLLPSLIVVSVALQVSIVLKISALRSLMEGKCKMIMANKK